MTSITKPQLRAPSCQSEKTYRITFADSTLEFECSSEVDVLDGMSKLGLRGIPVGCKGGGCGVCKVEVLSGVYRVGTMSRDHISEDEQRRNQVLACRIYPDSDLILKITGNLKKAFGLK